MEHISKKIEIEHKLLVLNFSPKLFIDNKIDFKLYHLTQIYLDCEPGQTKRIRCSVPISFSAEISYYYTTKQKTIHNDSKGNLEEEYKTTFEEYTKLLSQKNPLSKVINKYRYVFSYENQIFELDSFILPIQLDLLEAEVDSLHSPVNFPPFLQLVDITGVKEFSSKQISLSPEKTQSKIKEYLNDQE